MKILKTLLFVSIMLFSLPIMADVIVTDDNGFDQNDINPLPLAREDAEQGNVAMQESAFGEEDQAQQDRKNIAADNGYHGGGRR